jgi:hypothetical protein
MKIEWEIINQSDHCVVSRCAVINGWIVNSLTRNPADTACCESMVFVPDIKHEWGKNPMDGAE